LHQLLPGIKKTDTVSTTECGLLSLQVGGPKFEPIIILQP